MSFEITCPVCHFEHIPQDRDCCPQCDSDLICFRLLEALLDSTGDSMIDRPKDTQPPGQKESWPDTDKLYKSKFPGFPVVLVVIILLTSACLLGYTAHRFSSIQSMMQKLVQKLDTDMVRVQAILSKDQKNINKTLEAGTRQMDDLEKRVKELVEMTKNNQTSLARIMPEKETVSETLEKKTGTPETPEITETIDKIREQCFNTYRATDKDSLWTIARDLYGSGFFYPVLMEHNPDISVYSISSKDTLRYLCDKTQAAGVYKVITGTKQKRRYWNYTVRSSDTRKAIIDRYCLNKKDCLIEDKPLEIGMTIGVFLE